MLLEIILLRNNASTCIFADYYCVKTVRIWSFSGPYFLAFGLNTERYSYLSVFNLNAGKYRPEKLRIRTLFTQCINQFLVKISNLFNIRFHILFHIRLFHIRCFLGDTILCFLIFLGYIILYFRKLS